MQIQNPIVLGLLIIITRSGHQSLLFCSHSSSWQTTCPFHIQNSFNGREFCSQRFIRSRETHRGATNTMGTLNTSGLMVLTTCIGHQNDPSKRRRCRKGFRTGRQRPGTGGEKRKEGSGVIWSKKLWKNGKCIWRNFAKQRTIYMMAAALHSSWANWKLVHFTAINTPEEMRNEEGASNATTNECLGAGGLSNWIFLSSQAEVEVVEFPSYCSSPSSSASKSRCRWIKCHG